MSLSERLRPGVEAADWVIKEVKRLEAHCDRLEAERDRLLAFAADTLRNFWESSLEGDELQELGVKHGLLIPEERTVPCGEICTCAEYADEGDTLACYRYSPALLAALQEGK